jgi:hypothetical protein
MMELLRDGAWQAIGAFFTIAAIVASFAIYRWQRQRRALTYHVKSTYPLLKSTEELQGRLSVQVDGVAVRNIDVMFLEVQNSGNHPVSRSDFDVPFAIEFEPPAYIISAVVDAEEPDNLGVTLEVAEQKVTLQPILLNPGDKFTLKLLLSSDSKKFAITGRIIGIKEIANSRPGGNYAWLAFLGLALVLAGFWFAVANAPKRPDPPPRPPEVWYGIGVAIFGYLLAVYAIARRRLLPKLLSQIAKFAERKS